jgi:drug/metabolite transporter (DMT)-like permease
MPLRYWIILAAIGLAFGISFGLNESLLRHFGPLTLSSLRIAAGAAGCWLWLLATGRAAGVGAGAIAGIVVFGLLQYTLPFALIPLAQQHITSSTAGIANAMTPVAIVVVSQFWPGGEKATGLKLLAIALGVAGIVLLATGGAEAGQSDPRFVVVAVAAPFCYALALNVVRRLNDMDPVVIMAWAMTGGFLAIAPFALALESVPERPDAATIAALATLGVGLTTVPFIVMYSILPRIGATNLTLVTFFAPISATLLGVMVFGDSVGSRHLAGLGLILAGLVAIDGRLPRAIAARLAPGPSNIKPEQCG